MFQATFVAEGTIITEKGDSPAIEIAGAGRVLLVTLDITGVVEQEAFDLMIFGSTDGQAWIPKPILQFPQQFYVSQTPRLLDLRSAPEIKFLRAHWEVNRWGRGSERPRFELQVTLKEVPAELLNHAGKK
jgi:hypothetical protein